MTALPTGELRALVREVLREVLPAAVLSAAVTDRAAAPHDSASRRDTVELRDDADLDAFVRTVAARCADPGQRAALAEGRHDYRLAAPPPADAATDPGVLRIDRGAVTERTVAKAAAAGHRLVLGPRAVLTPLARDRARSLGVTITKEG